MLLEYTAFSTRGARATNQDSLLVDSVVHAQDIDDIALDVCTVSLDERWRAFAVADGMGGHAAGELASRFVLSRLVEVVQAHEDLDETILHDLILGIHQDLLRYGKENGHPGMGTTLSGLLIRQDGCLVFNVGDSRTWLYRNGDLSQLTKDHSIRNLPGMSEAPQNQLFSCLGGGQEDCTVDAWRRDELVMVGRAFIMSSDGFHEYMDFDVLESMLGKDLTMARLETEVGSVISRGSTDNASLVVLRVNGDN